MMDPDDNSGSADESWPENYINYFTEIEEHFRKVRGTSLFLLSPLDWALIENWKAAGVPLEAILKGIDDAFEKWRSRKVKSRQVNSLAYCTQAVMEAAKRLSGAGASKARQATSPPFEAAEVRDFLIGAAGLIHAKASAAYRTIATSLETLAAQAETHIVKLEELERRLTALEDKMVAIARSAMSEEELLEIRTQLDRELSPYRGKMTADQILMLERRYLDTRLLEKEQLPRLSLFYMR
jgi:hypothetical protein